MSAPHGTEATLQIPSFDGTLLHGRHWPAENPRGRLVISHGLGEHSGCYEEFARAVTAVPGLVDVIGFDYRGHGLSPGKRGVIRVYDELVGELTAVARWVRATSRDQPVFVLGHSNGGQVALRVVLEREVSIDGLVLSNPSLRLAYAVPFWKILVGRVLHRVAPHVTLGSPLLHEHMTRDSAAWPRRHADTLRHGRISPPLFFGMVQGGPQILARAAEIQVPTLMILSGSDAIVDASTSQRLFEQLGATDKTLRHFPEMLHEPLNDLGREDVYAAVIEWVSCRLISPSMHE
jgi:alpha-beta hydrolase superfamily lysophospholipase